MHQRHAYKTILVAIATVLMAAVFGTQPAAAASPKPLGHGAARRATLQASKSHKHGKGHKHGKKKHRKKRPMLPKGTPYGAEVIATITGHADMHYATSVEIFNVCEGKSSKTDYDVQFNYNWNSRFPQVTVPVATARQLGKAAKRLHLVSQPTSNGTGGLAGSSYAFDGHGPPTSGSGGDTDCGYEAYSARGNLKKSDSPTFMAPNTAGNWKNPYYIFVLGTYVANPETYVDQAGVTFDVRDEFMAIEDLIPFDLYHSRGKGNVIGPDFIEGDFEISELEKLVHSSSVRLPTMEFEGVKDCKHWPDNAGGRETCSVSWDFRYDVKLTKRFLYKTRRAYPK